MASKFQKMVLVMALLTCCLGSATHAADDRTWTLNFRDSDIQEVIKFVADATGKTVVINPLVKGKVRVISTEPLNSEQLYDLFLSVLEIHGFTAIESGNIVRIIPGKEARSSPSPLSDRKNLVNDSYITQVIPLHNVSAVKVLPVLRPLVPQQSHLAAYEAGNAIIIADTAANIARIRALIERIDQASVTETEMVSLQYAQAEEVVRIVEKLQSREAGKGAGPESQQLMVADARTNSILIHGDDLERERIRALILRLDQPGPQTGNVRVVYLEYAKAESLAKVLTNVIQNIAKSGGGDDRNGVTQQATVEADEDTNALLITAEGEVLQSLLQVVKRLDIRRAQVLVEAIIVEMEDILGRDLGIEWLFQNNRSGAFGSSIDLSDNNSKIGGIVGSVADDDGANIPSVGGALTTIAGQSFGIGRIDDHISFSVLVNALQQDTDANILSTPNLLTMDNHEASITVGQNVPFITGSFSNTGNGSSIPSNPFQTIQRESVGINLKVTPHINEGDAVVLDIEQEVSSLTGAAASDIITNERKINTQVLVDDGQTVVLGGLIKDDVQESVQKVPLLGSIPLLGRLFRSTSTNVTKTNLLVFIRATIIRDGKALTGATADKYRYIRDKQLQRRATGNSWINQESLPVLPEWQQENKKPEKSTQPAPDSEKNQSGTSVTDKDEGTVQ